MRKGLVAIAFPRHRFEATIRGGRIRSTSPFGTTTLAFERTAAYRAGLTIFIAGENNGWQHLGDGRL